MNIVSDNTFLPAHPICPDLPRWSSFGRHSATLPVGTKQNFHCHHPQWKVYVPGGKQHGLLECGIVTVLGELALRFHGFTKPWREWADHFNNLAGMVGHSNPGHGDLAATRAHACTPVRRAQVEAATGKGKHDHPGSSPVKQQQEHCDKGNWTETTTPSGMRKKDKGAE